VEPPKNLPRSAVLAACADMIRACGLTLEELAAHLHDPSAPAVHVVVRPPAVRALSDNDRRVIEAAGAADGVTVSGVIDLLGLRDAQAHRYCALLTKAGHLTGVKKPGIRAMHFFSSPASAQAWANDTVAAPFPNLAEHCPNVATPSARTPHKPKPLPHQNRTFSPPKIDDTKMRPAGEPVITDKTRQTLDTIKRPNSRIEAAPPLPPDPRYPSFNSMRPGMNPDTGKAWEGRP
jgi:hypothetical protein